MADDIQSGSAPEASEVKAETAPAAEAAKQDAPKQETPKQEAQKGRGEGQQRQGAKPQQQGQRREARPPGTENRGDRPAGDRGPRGERGRDDRRGGERGGERGGGDRGGDRREGRPGGGRPFELAPDIELDRLISDSLYLDNQAHTVVARMRDMDSGTKSQLRRLYNAVRRAVRAPESEKQHQFVMLRARLAYTIARHSLRSLDALERLLLQVTRKNDARGYERFKDLFEAIVAYNE
ncbi:MAG: type III-A CRISPR-associated protein Csm2 [Bryobacteraceae bacterium]